MKDYSGLTDDKLRRCIAERSGYTIIPWKGAYTIAYQGIPNDAYLGNGPDDAWGLACRWPYPLIPDWPRDTDAALTLCMDLAQTHDWHLVVRRDPQPDDPEGYTLARFAELNFEESITGESAYLHEIYCAYGMHTHTNPDARALAELAMVVLETKTR